MLTNERCEEIRSQFSLLDACFIMRHGHSSASISQFLAKLLFQYRSSLDNGIHNVAVNQVTAPPLNAEYSTRNRDALTLYPPKESWPHMWIKSCRLILHSNYTPPRFPHCQGEEIHIWTPDCHGNINTHTSK